MLILRLGYAYCVFLSTLIFYYVTSENTYDFFENTYDFSHKHVRLSGKT